MHVIAPDVSIRADDWLDVRPWFAAVRIDERDGVAVTVRVRIQRRERVAARPAGEPRHVVAGAVVGEAGLAVALLAGEAVALQADLRGAAARLEGGAAVGVVLLVGQ